MPQFTWLALNGCTLLNYGLMVYWSFAVSWCQISQIQAWMKYYSILINNVKQITLRIIHSLISRIILHQVRKNMCKSFGTRNMIYKNQVFKTNHRKPHVRRNLCPSVFFYLSLSFCWTIKLYAMILTAKQLLTK